MKKLILYEWGALSERNLKDALVKSGYEVIPFRMPLNDYDFDGTFSMQLLMLLNGIQADAVISYDYFPIISSICQVVGCPYLSWVYDMPHNTLYSKTLNAPTNRVFVFDRKQYKAFREAGCERVYYLPLAVSDRKAKLDRPVDGADSISMGNCVESLSSDNEKSYVADVSFLGNFYTGKHSYLKEMQMLPQELQKEAEQIVDSNVFRYGNLELRPSKELADALVEAADLHIGPNYIVSEEELVKAALCRQITAKERLEGIRAVAEHFPVTVYTGSSGIDFPGVSLGGYADYDNEMPLVFNQSRINLNSQLRYFKGFNNCYILL